MDKLLDKAYKKLDSDEIILSYLECSILTFIYRRVYRPGVILATNKKLFFYGFNLGNAEFTKLFKYENISSIKLKKGLFKPFIVFYSNGEIVKLSNIVNENIDDFLDVLSEKIK